MALGRERVNVRGMPRMLDGPIDVCWNVLLVRKGWWGGRGGVSLTQREFCTTDGDMVICVCSTAAPRPWALSLFFSWRDRHERR